MSTIPLNDIKQIKIEMKVPVNKINVEKTLKPKDKTIKVGGTMQELVIMVKNQFEEKNGFKISDRDCLELIAMRIIQNNIF